MAYTSMRFMGLLGRGRKTSSMQEIIANTDIRVTDDVILRSFMPEDWQLLVRYLNNHKVYENTLLIPYPYTREAAEGWIRQNLSGNAITDIARNFAISLPDGQLIGGIGYSKNPDPKLSHQAEIGYWLGEPYWNKGIMTQVVRLLSEWIFQHTAFTKLTASIFANNPASGRVLEKCGFQCEGLLRHHIRKEGSFQDCYVFGRLKE